MTEFIETDIPHHGIARYTSEMLEKVTKRAKNYRVPELRRLATSRLAGRNRFMDSAFYRLRRDRILAILASLETDQTVAEMMEREAEFTVTAVTDHETGKEYALRTDMSALPPLTITAYYDCQGHIQSLVTDTGAPVLGDARVRAVRAVRAYRVEHDSILSVTGPVETSYGPSYTIIATVDDEDIEAGYVFTDQDGGYVDYLTITADANRVGDDTRRAWYALVDAYRAGAGATEPEATTASPARGLDAQQPDLCGCRKDFKPGREGAPRSPDARTWEGKPLQMGDLVVVLVTVGHRHDGSGQVTRLTPHHVWVTDPQGRVFRARHNQVKHVQNW